MVETYYLHYPLLPVEIVFEIQFLILLNRVVNCICDVEESLVAVLVKHLDLLLLVLLLPKDLASLLLQHVYLLLELHPVLAVHGMVVLVHGCLNRSNHVLLLGFEYVINALSYDLVLPHLWSSSTCYKRI